MIVTVKEAIQQLKHLELGETIWVNWFNRNDFGDDETELTEKKWIKALEETDFDHSEDIAACQLQEAIDGLNK